MRIVDLSVALKAGIKSDPPFMLPSIEYQDHKVGAREFMMLFPGLKAEQLPNAEGPAMERVTITTHNGTHLDAPWHFASTMDGGKPAWKIDQVPLEWFFSDGVKLDFRNKPDGYVCKADDVKRELDIRMARGEHPHERRHERLGSGRHRRNAQSPRGHIGRFPRGVASVLQQSDDILRVRPERTARLGQADPTARPFEQLTAKLATERRDRR